MKEYGSNVQKLAEHLLTIADREQRTLHAHILVELMRQIHPNMRDGQDYSQKLWDDLYIMTKFSLQVDSPFAPPAEDAVGKKPTKMPYTQRHLKYRQYGKNMIILVEKAIALKDQEEKLAFVSYLIRQMKTFYAVWNKDMPEDHIVFAQLEDISGGHLKAELEYLSKNGLIDSAPRDKGSNVDRYQRGQQQLSRQKDRSNTNDRGNNTNNNRNNNNNNRGGDRNRNDNDRNRNNNGNSGNANNRFRRR
jgi:Domain of unknown function (DUF4290)